MDILQTITQEFNLTQTHATNIISLIDEGNTIPFISRYRKEATGALNDEQLRTLDERLKYLRNLEEKKEQVLSSIQEQGKLTEELKKQIETLQAENTAKDEAHAAEVRKLQREAVDTELLTSAQAKNHKAVLGLFDPIGDDVDIDT